MLLQRMYSQELLQIQIRGLVYSQHLQTKSLQLKGLSMQMLLSLQKLCIKIVSMRRHGMPGCMA
jgi:hypothetical protein